MKGEVSLRDVLTKEAPCDIEAEMAVLGCVLLSGDVFYSVSNLSPNDFFDDANRRIFTAIVLLHDAGEPVDDIRVVVAHLKAVGDFEKIGGTAYLAKLSSSAPTISNIDIYATIVKDHSRRRGIVQAASKAIARSYDHDDPKEIIDELESAHSRIGTGDDNYTTTLREDGLRRLKILENGADTETLESSIVETGFYAIDNAGGFRGGQHIVIAARPADGKSCIGKQIAFHAIKNGIPSLFVSLEMEQSEVADRVWSEQVSVDGRYIQSMCLRDEEKISLREAIQSHGSSDLHISTPVGRDATWSRIAGHAAMLHATHKIGLIVIDYLQLVNPRDDRQTVYEAVTEASKGAKKLARKLKVPVISLAQVGRDSDKGSRREPRLSDLRDSGSIEADADVVMFAHRITEKKPDFTFIIAKWRNSGLFSFPMKLEGKYTRFVPPKQTEENF